MNTVQSYLLSEESALRQSLILLTVIILSAYGMVPSFALTELVKVGGQGEIDFVLVPVELQNDRHLLKMACRRYTYSHTDYFCKMLMWKDKKHIPKKLPMNDIQLKQQFGCYDFNLRTKLNRLRIMKNGSVTEEY